MSENRTHEQLGDTSAAKLRNHEYVGKIGEDRAIGDHAGERNLFIGRVDAEAQRVPDRALDCFASAPFGPIGFAQEGMHQRYVDALAVTRDLVLHRHTSRATGYSCSIDLWVSVLAEEARMRIRGDQLEEGIDRLNFWHRFVTVPLHVATQSPLY